MKQEIQKIIEMSQSGSISVEQAAELISELRARDEASGPRESAETRKSEEPKKEDDNCYGFERGRFGRGRFWERHEFGHHHHGRGHHGHFGGRRGHDHGQSKGVWRDFLRGMDDLMSNSTGAAFASDLMENEISKSRMESPHGKEYVFSKNKFLMCHFSDLQLDHSEFVSNSLKMCHFGDVKMNKSYMLENLVHSSHIKNMNIQTSEILECEWLASKFVDVKLSDVSLFNKMKISSSHIKDIELNRKAQWYDSSIEASHIQGLKMIETTLRGSQIFGSHWTDVTLEKSSIQDFILRGVRWENVKMMNCQLKDILFSAEDKWGRQGYKNFELESCQLEKILFSGCSFKNVKIRNVNLQNLQIKNIKLSDTEIDGNEQFLKATKLA